MCHKIVIILCQRVRQRLLSRWWTAEYPWEVAETGIPPSALPRERPKCEHAKKAGVSDFQRSRQMTQSTKSPTPKCSSAGNKAPAVAFLRLHGA